MFFKDTHPVLETLAERVPEQEPYSSGLNREFSVRSESPEFESMVLVLTPQEMLAAKLTPPHTPAPLPLEGPMVRLMKRDSQTEGKCFP